MKRAFLVLVLLGATVTLLSGCALDTLLDGMVNREPRAVIDAKPTQGPAPLTVHLDAHYSHDDDGALVETRWDLGDPAATGSRFEGALDHEYKVPGTYVVKLTVTDNEGAMNGQQLAVVVTNPPPVAVAAVSDAAPHPGDEVKFDGSGSSDSFGKIVRYAWSFGDGNTSDEASPVHAYKDGGDYVATLTVTDDGGLSASATVAVRVQPGTSNCTGDTCGGNTVRPLAVMTIPLGWTSCAGGSVGVPLTFDGTASRPSSETGRITLYQWDFGDGTSASGATVEHTYTRAWRYTVLLTVTDSDGAVGVAQGVISIGGSGGSCSSQ